MIELPANAVEEAAYAANLDISNIYYEYSGRGMYGEKCFGIVHQGIGDLIRFLFRLKEELVDREPVSGPDWYLADLEWATGACQDSMGLRTITYWPNVKVKKED
jgi:hypothetical protein